MNLSAVDTMWATACRPSANYRRNVSRPTVREAVIALEVQGLVEVRVGSGAYVKRLPGKEDIPASTSPPLN
jgi:DNA-binding transcriptional regulator YhcF (GntR family)